ncbi:hypothetical protein ACTWPP_29775 [Actinomadura sp. 3N407]
MGWEVFYVSRPAVSRTKCGVVDAVTLLDRLALPDGTPVALDGAMRPVEPVCGWMRALAYERKQPETMRVYAYVVRRLGEFLAGRGCDLLSATEADLVAYRRARTEVGERVGLHYPGSGPDLLVSRRDHAAVGQAEAPWRGRCCTT